MDHRRQPRRHTYAYIGSRVWRRLLVALHARRVTVAVVLIALILFGLFSVRGVLRSEAALVGVMPIPVSAHQLEPYGDAVALVLMEKNGSRVLRVELALTEARVIALHQGVRVPGEQPQVYDLFHTAVQQLGGRVDHVIVADADQRSYMAFVVVTHDNERRVFRARAGEAATLALTSGAAIFVENAVLDRFGAEQRTRPSGVVSHPSPALGPALAQQ